MLGQIMPVRCNSTSLSPSIIIVVIRAVWAICAFIFYYLSLCQNVFKIIFSDDWRWVRGRRCMCRKIWKSSIWSVLGVTRVHFTFWCQDLVQVRLAGANFLVVCSGKKSWRQVQRLKTMVHSRRGLERVVHPMGHMMIIVGLDCPWPVQGLDAPVRGLESPVPRRDCPVFGLAVVGREIVRVIVVVVRS